jgi:CheY-like chemotaxis protein
MLRGKTSLLVDDDNDVRTAARALLAQFGCIVIEETNGRAAVARIASPERIDLVIIDFAMPGLTGADAGERMLAIRPGLPILVITGYADADELPGVGGRFPSLQKPFRGAQLAETLSSLVADSSPHAPTDVADHNQAASVLSFPRPRPRPREAESPIMPFSRRDIG